MRTLVTGGLVVSTTGASAADVLVEDERIVAVLEPGTTALGSDLAATSDLVIDATGKYVVPGGVDCHTHMEMPFGGTSSSDTFETGTQAAAWGGTTTIIDFAAHHVGERVLDVMAAWHAKAAGNCAIDYGFHQILAGVDDDAIKAMNELVGEGVSSFKMFMAYPGVFYSDDGQILRAMQAAADNGALIMMHAENGTAIDVLVSQALARGDTDPGFHGTTRPWETEEEAVHRAIMLARIAGAPVYFVHMSAKQAVSTVAAARDEGLNVFGETCPQYLYLSLEDHLFAPGFEGAKYVFSTPLRARAEGHQEALWRYLRTNDLSVVSTDHCPFCFKEQKELGQGNFSKIPNGLGGIEHRMDLIYQGVVDGQIGLSRWVELCSTTPARMFGMYPKKGVIAPGSDADLVIYDPNGQTRISVDTHHMNLDYSGYEGTVVAGHVDTVLSRGTVVIDQGRFLGSKSHGSYVRRSLSQYLV
ncbi:MAG: hydA [Acidimicrobiales bacterium]|nr:hydA [Acidimicrobiales bacterium]